MWLFVQKSLNRMYADEPSKGQVRGPAPAFDPSMMMVPVSSRSSLVCVPLRSACVFDLDCLVNLLLCLACDFYLDCALYAPS